jgi:hypothetical protein
VDDAALVEGDARRSRGRADRATVAVVAMSATVLVALAGSAAAKTGGHDGYVARADAVCEKTVDQIDAVVEDLGIAPSDDEGRAAGRKVLALGRAELVRLRALEAPAKDAAKVSAIYREIERGWDRVERRPRALFDEPARSPRRRSRGRLRARGVRPRLKHRSGHV